MFKGENLIGVLLAGLCLVIGVPGEAVHEHLDDQGGGLIRGGWGHGLEFGILVGERHHHMKEQGGRVVRIDRPQLAPLDRLLEDIRKDGLHTAQPLMDLGVLRFGHGA